MSRPSRVIVVFAVAFAAVLIGPPELGRAQFGPYPDLRWQDVLDIATPVIMLPAYWFLVRQAWSAPDLSWPEHLVFLGLAAIWAEGQGIHLAANSIDNLIHEDLTVPGGHLILFYDEVLGHYLWLVAIVGLAAFAAWRQGRHALAQPLPRLGAEGIAGAIYGFAFFDVVVEGGTGAFAIPAAVVLVLLPLATSYRRLHARPVAAFVLAAHGIALALFAGWWVYWGGRLPQFTEVGLF